MRVKLIDLDGRRLYLEQDIDPRYVVLDILSSGGETLVSRCILEREELAALGRAFSQPVPHPLKR